LYLNAYLLCPGPCNYRYGPGQWIFSVEKETVEIYRHGCRASSSMISGMTYSFWNIMKIGMKVVIGVSAS
jgi:hypothetical protein